MKTRMIVLFVLALAFQQCDSEDETKKEPTPAELLAGDWVIVQAKLDGHPRDEWQGMELTAINITDSSGTFLINSEELNWSAYQKYLCPQKSNWYFNSSSEGQYLVWRDSITVLVTYTPNVLKMQFPSQIGEREQCVPEEGKGCILEFWSNDWEFTFEPKQSRLL
jgi:hypothetical protein